MVKSTLREVTFLILAATLLAACNGSVSPTALPAVEVSPTSPCPSSGEITKSLATPQPSEVLIELAWEGGFTRPELASAFGRVSEFSLLPDGSAYYIDPPELDKAQVMLARLTPAEMDALVQRVLDLGFERLESYTDACQPQPDGTCMCVTDAGESVLRVRLPDGDLREIRNYYAFANDPEALMAIRTLLEGYRHPQAEPFTPDGATVFIRTVPKSPGLPILDSPLHPAWLAGGALDASCVSVLSGGDLQALLAVTKRNLGDFYFRVADADQVYNVYLVPWLPAVDYADLIASSGQACAPFEMPTSLLTLDNTEWVLTSLNGHSPVEGSAITLTFYQDNYMEGNAGCNSYGVDYTTGDGEFHVPRIHRTEQECEVPEGTMQQEAAYFDALASAVTYRATEDRLEFANTDSTLILVYARKLPPTVDLALRDTEWILMELRGKDLLAGSRITLNLAKEGFEGYAGCNNYGGEYEEADAGNWTTSSVWLTAMDCGQPALMDQERAFVAALGDGTAYRRANGRLEIVNARGEAILVFARKEEFVTQPSDLVGTAWRLVSIDGDSLIEDTTITLAFYGEHVLGGYAGCRAYVATYRAEGDDLNLLTEAMFDAGCSMEDALLEQEAQFMGILAPKADLRLGEGQLEIYGERGGVLVFEALPQEANRALKGPNWSLQATVGPNPFVEEPEPWPVPNGLLGETTITVTFEGSVARGSGGCNSYGAPYSRRDGALSFEEIVITERDCLDPEGIMEQERHYVDLLGAVSSYQIFGDHLWLETSDGRAFIFTAP